MSLRHRMVGNAPRAVLAAVVLVFLTACQGSPSPIDGSSSPTEGTPTPGSGDSVQFSIDLPEGWNDLIDDYREEVPNTVLSAVWTTASELDVDEPFATVSVGLYGPGNDPRREVREDLDSWEVDFEDSVRGESGVIETEAGGAGRWGSISGTMNGQEKTIVSVHLYHGPYELMVLIETFTQDDAKAYEILEALETVEFTGPTELNGRAGRPLDEDGRWYSYCRTVSMPVQESWAYDFDPSYDREPWDCPVDVDYLGAWIMDIDGSEHVIAIYRYRSDTLAEVQSSLSFPEVVGDSVVSPAGYTHTLVSQEPFVLANGTTGVLSQDRLESPSGVVDFGQLLGFDTPDGGSVAIMIFNWSGDGFKDDLDEVFDVLEDLTVEDAD